MLLHEYWEDNDGSRYASVKREEDGSYTVSMYENNRLIEDRNIKGHSEIYSENCAENWVLRVIK